MKATALFFLLSIFIFSPALFAGECSTAAQITLPAGTSISFLLNEEVTSTNAEVGNIIELRVRGHVTVNGMVVIRDGAIAEGEITRVRRNCGRRCPESLSIMVTSTLAVDGQRISVQGSHFKRSATCKRCSATINSGARLKATVLNDTEVNA